MNGEGLPLSEIGAFQARVNEERGVGCGEMPIPPIATIRGGFQAMIFPCGILALVEWMDSFSSKLATWRLTHSHITEGSNVWRRCAALRRFVPARVHFLESSPRCISMRTMRLADACGTGESRRSRAQEIYALHAVDTQEPGLQTGNGTLGPKVKSSEPHLALHLTSHGPYHPSQWSYKDIVVKTVHALDPLEQW